MEGALGRASQAARPVAGRTCSASERRTAAPGAWRLLRPVPAGKAADRLGPRGLRRRGVALACRRAPGRSRRRRADGFHRPCAPRTAGANGESPASLA